MKKNQTLLLIMICFILVLISQSAFADVKLPRLVSDGMVLQRDANVNIWGWAGPAEKVTIKFLGKTLKTTADDNGKWQVSLSALKAGGPYKMEITANNKITLNDILIGDVWICTGQSNMVLPMTRVKDQYPEELATANNPEIRLFTVVQRYDFNTPLDNYRAGKWKAVSKENIASFSAASYFFAKALYQKYQIPVGIINASVGGTPIQAWMSVDALKAFPEDYLSIKQYQDSTYIAELQRAERAAQRNWSRRLDQLDCGLQDPDNRWYNPGLDDSDWQTIPVPSYWADEGLPRVNGVVWFRKEVDVPESMTGVPARLNMGRVVDADSTYVNGQFVGNITYLYPPRKYDMPAGLLVPGKNQITVRVVNNGGKGGFFPDKPYELIANGDTLDLKGEWKVKIGAVMDRAPGQTFVHYNPSGLFNGMVSPMLPYTIKGALWYQGESNANFPWNYGKLLSAMATDWRAKWGLGNFPFIIAQLPNYMASKPYPSESNWAVMRQQQLNTLALPNSAIAVLIDAGEWNDIHPTSKKVVGDRLALCAMKLGYGEDIVYSGPLYKSMQIDGNKVILSFSNIGSGLVARGGELKEFSIAGKDGKYIWAKAEIKGDQVIVWCDKVEKPVSVRYAWADNPDQANLYNKEGLPASPFEAK